MSDLMTIKQGLTLASHVAGYIAAIHALKAKDAAPSSDQLRFIDDFAGKAAEIAMTESREAWRRLILEVAEYTVAQLKEKL